MPRPRRAAPEGSNDPDDPDASHPARARRASAGIGALEVAPLVTVDRARLLRVLAGSSDPNNPGPDEILEILRRAASVAVVGMSRDPAKPARRVPSYLAANGFDVIPVNPNATRILGKPVRPSLAEVIEPVDIVILFRPSDQVKPFIREAAGRPERPVIWLQEGIRSDEDANEARKDGLTVIQDLCIFKVHRLLEGEDPASAQ